MPPSSPPDSVVAGVLRDCWGIAVAPERVENGASRNTWRVGGGFWLSHSDAMEEARFRREAQLLNALQVMLARPSSSFCVPEVVATVSGESIAATRAGVWRLSRHLPGEQPDMQKAGTYPALARLLTELHAVLECVPPSLKVCDPGAVEGARAFIRAYGMSSFSPATDDAREARAVGAIANWLAPRIEELASLPRQLTHGDWTPPNIKVIQEQERWGVLDWEFARVDPVVMDLAQSCSTILMWSGLSDPAEHMLKLVETYSAHSGREVNIESVRAAMAVYWLQNYNHWRDRQEKSGNFRDVLARQPGRLLEIAAFVGAR